MVRLLKISSEHDLHQILYRTINSVPGVIGGHFILNSPQPFVLANVYTVQLSFHVS